MPPRALIRSSETATEERTAAFWIKLRSRWALVICALAIGALYFSASRTPGKTPDSFAYLKAAAEFARSFEFGADYVSWPPLYPAVLAPLSGGHLEHYLGFLNYFLFSVFVYGSLLLFRALGCGPILTIVMGLAVAHSSPVQFVFPQIWSETLFLPLSLFWLLHWSRYLAGGERRDLILACIANGLCLMTRHIGVSMTGTMMATLVLFAGQRGFRQTLQTMTATAASTIPYVLWLVRTEMVSQTLTGPRPPRLQSFEAVLSGFAATLSHWLYPGIYLPGADPFSIAACLAMLLLVCGIGTYATRKIAHRERMDGAQAAMGNSLAATSAIFITAYLAVLLWGAHETAIDRLSDRFLAPLFVPQAILGLYGFARLQEWLGPGGTRPLFILRAIGVLWVLGDIVLP